MEGRDESEGPPSVKGLRYALCPPEGGAVISRQQTQKNRFPLSVNKSFPIVRVVSRWNKLSLRCRVWSSRGLRAFCPRSGGGEWRKMRGQWALMTSRVPFTANILSVYRSFTHLYGL